MKNLKISLQLIVLIGGLMAAFAAATYFEVRSSTATIYQQRYELLRTQVESALSVLKDFNDRAVAGEFTVEEAKTRAYDMLNKMRFEPDGYFFGYDYDVVMVFHPTSKDVGKSNKGKPDANGFAYRDELVRLGQQAAASSSSSARSRARIRKTAPIPRHPTARPSSRGRSSSSLASTPTTSRLKSAPV